MSPIHPTISSALKFCTFSTSISKTLVKRDVFDTARNLVVFSFLIGKMYLSWIHNFKFSFIIWPILSTWSEYLRISQSLYCDNISLSSLYTFLSSSLSHDKNSPIFICLSSFSISSPITTRVKGINEICAFCFSSITVKPSFDIIIL